MFWRLVWCQTHFVSLSVCVLWHWHLELCCGYKTVFDPAREMRWKACCSFQRGFTVCPLYFIPRSGALQLYWCWYKWLWNSKACVTGAVTIYVTWHLTVFCRAASPSWHEGLSVASVCVEQQVPLTALGQGCSDLRGLGLHEQALAALPFILHGPCCSRSMARLSVSSAFPPHSQNLLQAVIDASNLLQPVISHARQSF